MRLNTIHTQEIQDLRQNVCPTRRATVQAVEDLLYDVIPVLDHGFIRVIDYMGDDNAVVQAARVSYGRGTKKVNEDQGLINYLLRHWHSTPFEMCEIKFHIKLPIFVARQWIRHRTANVNEYSARYSILDNEFYVPAPAHLAVQSKTNRQGRGEVLTGENADRILKMLREDSLQAYRHYQDMLNEDENGNPLIEDRPGLARELARMNLPINFYTQWYWKVDLHNLMNFLNLRADAHAQFEIRAYADAMIKVLEKWVPMTAEAFHNYRKGGVQLSAKAMEVVKGLVRGQKITHETTEMSAREWRELMELLELDKK